MNLRKILSKYPIGMPALKLWKVLAAASWVMLLMLVDITNENWSPYNSWVVLATTYSIATWLFCIMMQCVIRTHGHIWLLGRTEDSADLVINHYANQYWWFAPRIARWHGPYALANAKPVQRAIWIMWAEGEERRIRRRSDANALRSKILNAMPYSIYAMWCAVRDHLYRPK